MLDSGEATMLILAQNKGWSFPHSELLDTDYTQKARNELVN